MERKYLNESHRKYSEACQKEVAEMSRRPLSAELKERQMRHNRENSSNPATQENRK